MKATRLRSLLVVTIALLAFSACTFLEEQAPAAKVAVTYATFKYIERGEDPTARATRVRTVAEDVKRVASGDGVTLAALEAAAIAQIPKDLSAADRYLAITLVNAIAAELVRRTQIVGEGGLDPEQLLAVNQVLGWVIEATEFIAPSG